MDKYKSPYPTLKQAKTRWSNPKDPFSASHLKWVKKAKDIVPGRTAKTNLDASAILARMTGKAVNRQQRIVGEAKDRIGTPTPSIEAIAKKHGKDVSEIEAQLVKGVKVEREHTKSDAEAHEIARDHLDEFPDYYDRLDKMEKKAKKEVVNEISDNKLGKYIKKAERSANRLADRSDNTQDPDWKKSVKRSVMVYKSKAKLQKNMNEATYHARVIAHPAVADVDHGGSGDYFVNLKKGWHLGDGSRSFGSESPRHAWKMLKHATQKDYKKWVDEGVDYSEQDKEARKLGYLSHAERMMIAKLHSFKDGRNQQSRKRKAKEVVKEHGLEESMSVGAGAIAGMPTADPPEKTPVGSSAMLRRKKFAGKQVFVVDPDTFYKATWGKRKYEHYEKYLEGCEIAEEIREFGRTYWDEPIILQNEKTGAMVYLKYGSK